MGNVADQLGSKRRTEQIPQGKGSKDKCNYQWMEVILNMDWIQEQKLSHRPTMVEWRMFPISEGVQIGRFTVPRNRRSLFSVRRVAVRTRSIAIDAPQANLLDRIAPPLKRRSSQPNLGSTSSHPTALSPQQLGTNLTARTSLDQGGPVYDSPAEMARSEEEDVPPAYCAVVQPR